MIINLISNLNENSKISELYNFNHVVAWSLKTAFEEYGVTCRLVQDRLMEKNSLPKATHSIVISAIGMKLVRGNRVCRERLRASVTGKSALYLDSDFGKWHKIFDKVFTVVEPVRQETEYVYAGWGANPDFFFPDQDEKALYMDSLMYGKYNNVHNHIYDIYVDMMEKTDLTVYFPLPEYNKRKNLIYWPDFMQILRKCNFYCCTQVGESGLTRIESATCGALLVVPKDLYRSRTMGSLEHMCWSTEDELLDILAMNPDPWAIRKRALKHSWLLVAKRILDELEKN